MNPRSFNIGIILSFLGRLAIFGLLVGVSAYAQERELKTDTTEKVDAVLLLDNSGSMRLTDPSRLRDEGAKLFVQFLKAGDRLAIIQFAQDAQVVRPLSDYTPEQAPSVAGVLAGIDSSGIYTDLLSGIKSAKDILETNKRPDANQVIILLSDGRMDPDPAVGSAETRTIDLVNNYLPDFKAKGIKIDTLYFSEEADKDLLAQVALGTNGLNWYTPSSDKIHESYASLFLAVKKPQVVPLKSRGFTIDKDIEEATFYINRENSAAIGLVSPAGVTIGPETTDANIKWYNGKNFDVISIISPEVGDWQVNGLPSTDSFATVLTNLKLVTDWSPSIFSGTPALLQARLYEQERPIALNEIAGVTQFGFQVTPTDKISEPILRELMVDDGTHGDKIAGDGIFSSLVTIKDDGEYRLRVVAQSPTFERNQQIPFRVKPRLVELTLESAEVQSAGHEEGEPQQKLKKEYFKVQLSPEASGLRAVEMMLKAVDQDKKQYLIKLVPAKESKSVFLGAVASLPQEGEYELTAYLKAEDKKEKIKAESEPLHYIKSAHGDEPEPEIVVVEEKVPEGPPLLWPWLVLVTLVNVGLGAASIVLITKTQITVNYATPEFASLDPILEAAEVLAARAAITEIDLNDPIFTDDKYVKGPIRKKEATDSGNAEPPKEAVETPAEKQQSESIESEQEEQLAEGQEPDQEVSEE